MSGGKGTSSTQVPTSSAATNPLAKYVTGAADYLTPYAQDPNRPYTAPPNPYQTAGYQNLVDTGNNLGGWPTAKQYDAYGNLITGGGTSPAYGGYQQFAAGGAGPQQTADRVVNNAVNAGYSYANPITGYANQATAGNVGQDELADVTSGKYVDPKSNPYAASVLQNILDPTVRNFRTSVMPSIDAAAARSGRGGSGSLLGTGGLYGDAETTLANTLGNTSEKFNFDLYNTERARQDAGAIALDQAKRQGLGLGITGLQAAGNLVDQGERTALTAADLTQRGEVAGLGGLTTGFNTGLTTQEQALRDYNNFATGQMIPANADITAGTGLRTLDQSMLSEPYDKVNAYLKAITAAGANAAGASSSSTTPYYTNNIASGLSAASGVLGLGKQLGIGDLFGGGAGAAAGGTFGGGGAAGAGFSSLGDAIAGGLPLSGFGFSEPAAALALSEAAPAAAAGGKAAGSFLPFLAASDRRLKEAATIIGKVGALPLYSFRYKGDSTPRIGFMADEVEQVDPRAVHSMAGGFKAVDYERAVKSALK